MLLTPQLRERTAYLSNGCWIYENNRVDGKAVFYDQGVKTFVHRYLYEKRHGINLNKRQIFRVCSTENCINPDHYELAMHRGDPCYFQMTYWLPSKSEIYSQYGKSTVSEWLGREVDRIQSNQFLRAKVKYSDGCCSLFVRRL